MITQDQVLQMELACEELVEGAVFLPATVKQILKSYWRSMEALQALYNSRPFEPDARKEADSVLRDAKWRDPVAEEMS